jgi:hypothetical protein
MTIVVGVDEKLLECHRQAAFRAMTQTKLLCQEGFALGCYFPHQDARLGNVRMLFQPK